MTNEYKDGISLQRPAELTQARDVMPTKQMTKDEAMQLAKKYNVVWGE